MSHLVLVRAGQLLLTRRTSTCYADSLLHSEAGRRPRD